MPAAFVEDLTLFFADFGVPAVVGVNPAITVIFDRAYISQLSGRVAGSGPECLGLTADLGAMREDDTITIDGVPYSVAGEPQSDGTGLTILQLRG
jgi:hypothetical protein